jgi:hypothetical protein
LLQAKNVLFCLKNNGLAKEPDHTPADSLYKNDIPILYAITQDRCLEPGEELSAPRIGNSSAT